MPWVYTTRHGDEAILRGELIALGAAPADVRIGLPDRVLPGLVVQELDVRPGAVPLRRWDAVWALQVLPDAAEVRAPSIAKLAAALWERASDKLRETEGLWRLHVLVPGQLKGNPKPPLRRRADLLHAEILDLVRTHARLRGKAHVVPPAGPTEAIRLDLLVQVLLADAETAWISASPVWHAPPLQAWPSRWPAGLYPVADDPVAPASSFRKLEEALACLGVAPRVGEAAVDLGASPGGWTRVLHRLGATVTAVDRSPLAPHLMATSGVRFVRGDAFRWRPDGPVDWLVSDIAAYPERVVELVEAWSTGAGHVGHGPKYMILQMKFKGTTDWRVLHATLDRARQLGWHARAKHFFNDKHEASLLCTAVQG
jgi:23S rRNA (cytidine2498-2'-O)-methyltransferase